MQIGEQMQAFQAECSHAAAVSREVLRKLLQENRNTEYGKTYGFGDMTDLEEYRKLPLTDYADFAEAIRRMQAGERNVLTAYEPKYFLKTSGSSGVQKTIPLTQRALEQGWDLVYAASLAQMQGMEEKKHLHTSVFRIDEKDRETLLSCAYFQYFREKDSKHCEKYIGGERLLFSKEIGDICYVKL
ncbi:MAG: GH3 auxin-responsive promoter family protein, partial [Anaerotignum sp.]